MIAAADAPAIWIKAGATVNLTLEGENTLIGGAGCAGICVDPAYAENAYSPDESAKLIVSGNGNLTVNGGDGDSESGMFGGAAGIGGNGQNFDREMGGVDFGVIIFSEEFSGEIHAYGGQAYAVSGMFDGSKCSFGGGAGIGSGGFDCANFDWNTVCGRIHIYNGNITANADLENAAVGAGIGSGTGGLTEAQYTDFSDILITIDDGNILAQGGDLSAGIGGGSLCDGGNIYISGGNVVAKAGAADGALGASGIGGGNDGGVLYQIDITGGEVTAIASGGAAGIGGASNTSYSNLQYGDTDGNRSEGKIGIINISGKNTVVNAYGGTATEYSGTYGGAGIGAGYPVGNNARSVAFDISITDGATVNAYGGYHAQAIGYGYRPGSNGQYYTGYGIKLVLDDTTSLWAQNYDYFQPALVAVTEYDESPITYESNDTYLVFYTDENGEATEATSGEVKSCLKWAKEQTTENVEWSYSDGELSVANYESRTVENLKGNWATLYSTPTIAISYKWVTTDNPTDVNVPSNETIEAGTDYFSKTQTATTQGYRFDGWYTDADCTQLYQDGSVLNSDTNLYGKWEKMYNVSYDPNGGDGTMTDNNSPYIRGASVTVMENKFIRDDYKFKGWNTASDGNGESYFAENLFVIQNDTTLYAQWEKISVPAPEYGSLTVSKTVSGGGASKTTAFTFTVTLDSGANETYGDMTFANGVATFTLKANESKTASDLPAGVGYTVEESGNAGYTVTVNGTNGKAAAGTIAANTTETVAFHNYKAGGGIITYYTLRYESNGGTEYEDERYASGTTVKLNKASTREGYAFTGWYADQELTEKISSIKMNGSKTVYAGWRASTVPDMLNGEKHYAYVIGYSDGLVHPEANITRAQTAAIFFRLLKSEARDESLTSANAFEDVEADMWFCTEVSTMAKLGIVKGRTAECFDPDAPITRAEFAAICARFDTGLADGDSDFTDISGHWAKDEIERAASLGWIRGYTDGTFRPDQYITRAEAMTMINRVLNRIPEDEEDLLSDMNVWPDNVPGDWYYLAVQEATNSHEFEHKGEIYETWTTLTTDPDWTKYQK